MEHSLDRFLDAQNAKFNGYDVALAEIKAGRKSSHWMWYIFPQLRGLGRSYVAGNLKYIKIGNWNTSKKVTNVHQNR